MQRIQTDSEDAPLFRQKTCPTGWHYRAVSWQFSLGTGSIVGDFATISHTATKTTVEIEFTKNVEIISGEIESKNLSAAAIANFIVAAHISEENGGSKKMVTNYDLSFKDCTRFDGRSSKHITYDAVYHSGKISVTFDFAEGTTGNLQLTLEVYEE